MLNLLGDTQKEILKFLAKGALGTSIDEIAEELGITRTAVNQHLANLERRGFVENKSVRETGGRPLRLYTLSDDGRELFPKKYSWFSALLLTAIKKERGSHGLKSFLKSLAREVSDGIKPSLKPENTDEKIEAVAELMKELGYEAKSIPSDDLPEITASNCVYHHLASEHPEVCQFDLELLASLVDAQVEHKKCIVKGHSECQFKFQKKLGVGDPGVER